jgi:hypothetical protein
VALAVAGQVGKGRLFAMGDPSAVINMMLRYPGNRSFARGLVRYLVDDDSWGTRQGKLVIVSNRFVEKGAYGAETASSRELAEWMRNLRGEVQRVSGEGLPRQAALVLAVAAAGMLLLWVASTASRRYQPPVPRYARSVPLLLQGGAAGRAAVLAAPSTHRGLVLLEQKDALEEEVGVLLGMDKPPTMNVLVDVLAQKRLVDAVLLAELKTVLLEMARVETAVSAGAPVRTPRSSLDRAERVVREVVAQVTARVRQGA